MADNDIRSDSYPSAPAVGWRPSKAEIDARRAFMDRRNLAIAMGGAQRAIEAVKGGSIGAAKSSKP